MKNLLTIYILGLLLFTHLMAKEPSAPLAFTHAEQNLSKALHFSIMNKENKKHIDNIHLRKHFKQWHLSFDNNTDQSTLCNQSFQAMLAKTLLHIKTKFPSITIDKVRVSTALVDEVWQGVLSLSVEAMKKEHGMFSLKERGPYSQSLEYSFDAKHPFVQKSCQLFTSLLTLNCNQKQPIQVHNQLFKAEYMHPRMTWENLQKLKEKAFDRKSKNISYLRFNFTETKSASERQ